MMSKNQEAISSQILAKMTRKERKAYLKFEKKLQAEAWDRKWLTAEGWLSRFGDHFGSLINKLTTDDIGMIAAAGLGAFATFQSRKVTESYETVGYEYSPEGQAAPIRQLVKKEELPPAEKWLFNVVSGILGYRFLTVPSTGGVIPSATQVLGVSMITPLLAISLLGTKGQSLKTRGWLERMQAGFRLPTEEEYASAERAWLETGAV